ncbi:hypothetical protein [Streptomyces sp. NPDC048172]
MIAHVCNDQGDWGKGFVLAEVRWERVEPMIRSRLTARGVPVTVYDQ